MKNEPEKRIVSSFEDKCNTLVSSLFQNLSNALNIPQEDVCTNTKPIFTPRLSNICTNNKWEWPDICMDELVHAVPGKKTAPGQDQKTWIMIRKAMKAIPQIFLRVVRALLYGGYHSQI